MFAGSTKPFAAASYMERPLTSSPRHNGVMANSVFDAVRTIMAIRDYQQKPIPADVVTRIVDAGRLTASAANHQEWHFVVVREPENLRALGSLVKTGPYIAKSMLAIVVAYEKNSRTGVSDCSRAIQSMLLTAWGEGVGSNWTGFGSLEDVRNKVSLPDRYEVIAVLPFGYPARPVKGRKKRKPLSEVASAERFGAPLV
jgi:nitroreductase